VSRRGAGMLTGAETVFGRGNAACSGNRAKPSSSSATRTRWATRSKMLPRARRKAFAFVRRLLPVAAGVARPGLFELCAFPAASPRPTRCHSITRPTSSSWNATRAAVESAFPIAIRNFRPSVTPTFVSAHLKSISGNSQRRKKTFLLFHEHFF